MMNKKPVILCVDDQKVVLDAIWDQIAPVLEEEFLIELCESAGEALELIEDLRTQDRHIAVVISDQLMPEMRGDEFLIKVHQKLPQTLKIMLTGQAGFEAVKNAINQARLYRFISKPWQEDDFILTVTEAARSYQQYLQLIEYNRILRSLNKATQEISGEIKTPQLLNRLLETVLENTGAENCYLVLEKSGALTIDSFARRTESGTPEIVLQPAGGDSDSDSAFDTIIGSLTGLLQNGALSPHSLVTPIGTSADRMGYLFVNVSSDDVPFNNNHLEVLQMLASQAAISLENARLVASIEERSRELEEEKEKTEAMNVILEQKNSEVSAQKQELEAVNRIVAQKNNDILDSIRYARRIQLSVLPDEESLYRFFPEAFVYYHAKDIVSGDFYWWSYRKPHFVIAACDCTGHGVPGAFMSLMGVNFLNQTVNEYQIVQPGIILDYLHTQIQNVLKSEADRTAEEGMDCAIVSINMETNEVQMAGARRPVYGYRQGELKIFPGSKCSIGESSVLHEARFEQHEFTAEKGDTLYLFSDGYVDQFGGPNYRKYTPKRFQNLLTEMQPLDMKTQHAIIEKEMNDWRGKHEQTDDLIVIGLRF